MKGVFQSGDLLLIKEIQLKNLSKGDVVVFYDTREISEESLIVHRVIEKHNGHITARGDNNIRPDVIPVNRSNIIGKVFEFERRGKTHKVINGLTGFYIAKFKYFLRKIFVQIYDQLIRISLVEIGLRFILKIFIRKIKKVEFISQKGGIIKWVHKQKVIARKGPGKGDFYCQKPFNLIIKK